VSRCIRSEAWALTMVVPPLAMHLCALILGRRWSHSFGGILEHGAMSWPTRRRLVKIAQLRPIFLVPNTARNLGTGGNRHDQDLG
jgi:hypothetical protein